MKKIDRNQRCRLAVFVILPQAQRAEILLDGELLLDRVTQTLRNLTLHWI